MNEEMYFEALIGSESYSQWSHPCNWGTKITEDYINCEDIPNLNMELVEEYIAIVNYYFYWFPLVKGSL